MHVNEVIYRTSMIISKRLSKPHSIRLTKMMSNQTPPLIV